MTETFEIGQKVRVRGIVEGEITYGPFSSTFGAYTGYVVRIGETEELQKERDLSAIPVTPRFAVGDVVTLTTSGAKATVEYGPFDDRDVYVVKLVEAPADPDAVRTFTTLASAVKPLEPVRVGDRVRVVEDDPDNRTGEYVGKIGIVDSICLDSFDGLPYVVRFGNGTGAHGTPDGKWCVKAVERVEDVEDEDTYTHDGVAYDLTATYRDSDGDVWRLARIDGVIRAQAYGLPATAQSRIFDEVTTAYGPLTRV